MNDNSRLMNDLNVIVSTLCPDTDLINLSIRLEEVLSNYNISRKSLSEIESDIPDNIEVYLASKKLEGFSNKTIKCYNSELMMFSDFFKKPLAQITTADIRKYLSSFSDVKSSTIGTKLSVLKSFFSWLVSEEILLRNPTSKIKLPKTPDRLPKGLTIEELELIRESCQTLRERALIEVMYSTAGRLHEIVNMDKDDINIQKMSTRIIGKGNKERISYLSFKALYHLKKYLNSRSDNNDALFVTERKPFNRISGRSIEREIDEIHKRSGISKKLTPHVLRHSYACLSMDAGIELADLQSLMGHSQPSTTLVYAKVSEERKQQAFKKYHVQ